MTSLAPLLGENLLAGTYPGRTLASNEAYYLRTVGTNANLYRATSGIVLQPFSCYLPSAEKQTYLKIVEEEQTGIEAARHSSSSASQSVYNVGGQRLQKEQKGVNIVGGRKILR